MRARTPERLPVVLSRTEVAAILARLNGVAWLVVMLLYGGGLRLEECLALRVKDIDLERRQVVVQPDRTTRQVQRSTGVRPVRLAMRTSMRGPISSLS